MSAVNEFQIIAKGRGKVLLLSEYQFYRQRVHKSGQSTWRCKKYKNKKCGGSTTLAALADKLPEQVASLSISQKIQQPAYHIKTITSKDRERTLDFLRRFFFRDEPLNLAVNLLETPSSRCLELEEYAASSLDHGVSLAAVDDNGEFVGLVINALVHRSNIEDKTEECPHQKFRRILRLLTHLNNEAKIWEKVPASENVLLELRIASTHPDWRGRRIMKVLAEESERIAKSHGACGIRMDATSAFSARAAERLGYSKIYCIKYADIPDGPQPNPPHFEACVYLKKF